MKLNKNDLMQIKGGALSVGIMNAIIRGIAIIIDLGRSIGSSIRRASSNKACDLK